MNSDSRKWIEYGLNNVGGGKFRSGHKFDFSPYATIKPRSNLDFTPSMDETRIWGNKDYDYKDTVFRVWRLRSRWSPTLNLSFRGTIQYVEDEKVLLSNFLLAYNWHPGSWFYIVYDETRDTQLFAYNNPGDRTLRLKFTYFMTVPS